MNTILFLLFITSLILLINLIGAKLFHKIKGAIYGGTALAIGFGAVLMVLSKMDAEGMKSLAYLVLGMLLLISGIVSFGVTFLMRRYVKKHPPAPRP